MDVDREEVVRRLSGRWLCSKTPDHVYHAIAKPPKVAGKCDIDGAPLIQRDDDKPETIRARLEQQLPPMYEVVDYYTRARRAQHRQRRAADRRGLRRAVARHRPAGALSVHGPATVG